MPIIISNSAHTITSFRVFVINIIKMNWIGRIATITNLVRCIYLENAGVSPSHLSASCTPECVSERLMKVALFLHWFSLSVWDFFLFSIWFFFHEHLWITELQRKGEGVSLTPHYQFHLLQKHLDIGPAITAESSPLHIASSRNRTRNHWFMTRRR